MTNEVTVPVELLTAAVAAIDSLTEIVYSAVNLPEGQCTCITSPMPPCGFCENNGQWRADVEHAEGTSLNLSQTLDRHHLERGLTQLAVDLNEEGFGSF